MIKKILKQINIFSSLSDDDLNTIADISTLHKYKNNSNLFIEGNISSDIIILIDGIVSVFKTNYKGDDVVLSYFNKYSLIAEAATLRKTPLPSSAKFQSDGEVIKIDINKFEKIMLRYPSISLEIIQSLLHKIDLLQQNIHFNLASNSIDKIIEFYKQNPKLSRDLKQYEIASILGMTPETLSRNIKKLIKQGRFEKLSFGYKVNN